MKAKLSKKIYTLMIIISALLSLLFIVRYVSNLKFKVTGYDKKVDASSSYIDIRFNKKITNFEQIYKEFSVKDNINMVMSLLKNDTILRLSSSEPLEVGSKYTVVIPLVQSGDQHLNNLSLTFEIIDGDSEDVEFDGNKGVIYENNLRKYSFMNNNAFLDKTDKMFTVECTSCLTSQPVFLVSLILDESKDYNKQESYDLYLKAFDNFKLYITEYSFKVEDLKIEIYPTYMEYVLLPESNVSDEELGD